MHWDLLAPIFEADGSLRDIYVLDTTVEDWERLLRGLQAAWPVRFFHEDSELALPSAAECFARADGSRCLLTVDLGADVVLHAHFFTPDEIELDLSPRAVHDAATAQRVLDFLVRVGDLLEKPVRLTPESWSANALVTYDPQSGALSVHPDPEL